VVPGADTRPPSPLFPSAQRRFTLSISGMNLGSSILPVPRCAHSGPPFPEQLKLQSSEPSPKCRRTGSRVLPSLLQPWPGNRQRYPDYWTGWFLYGGIPPSLDPLAPTPGAFWDRFFSSAHRQAPQVLLHQRVESPPATAGSGCSETGFSLVV